MHKLLLFVGCLLALRAGAQDAGFKPLASTDAFKKEFAKASQDIRSIQCDFVQQKNLSMLSDKIVSTGKFWFKRDNMVRMEYEKPSYYLLVINGNSITTKDAQKENHVSAKSNKMFDEVNKMMIDCVQGTVLENRNFTTRVFENAHSYMVEMTPVVKNLKEIFKSITLTISKKDYTATKMEMDEQSGDNTVIEFLHKQLNANIPDAVFSVK